MNDVSSSFQESIRCKILSTAARGSHTCDIVMISMDTVSAMVRIHLPDAGQICTIKISAGSQDIFSMIRQHFKL